MATLLQRIEDAFPSEPRPGNHIIFASDSEGAEKIFNGCSWKDIPAEKLDYHSSILHVFSTIGFAYYLPAFMITALQHPDLGVVTALITNLTPPKFDPNRPSFADRWNLLNRVQKQCAIAFLRHFRDYDSVAIGMAISALEVALSS